MDEKDVSSNLVVESVLHLIERTKLKSKKSIFDDLSYLTSQEIPDKNYVKKILSTSEKIVDGDWFKTAFQVSEKIKKFKEMHDRLQKLVVVN